MAVNDRTASSRQLAAHWSTATGVQLSASSIRRRLLRRGLRARVPLYRIPLTADHRRLRRQWALEHRDWRADWHQVVFSDESRFNLWTHDGRVRVRRYAGQRCLPECIIERHSGRTPGVMVWGAISYHGRSNLIRIEGNLNSNRYVREVLQPEVVPFLQGIPGAIFQQDNARPHVARTSPPRTIKIESLNKIRLLNQKLFRLVLFFFLFAHCIFIFSLINDSYYLFQLNIPVDLRHEPSNVEAIPTMGCQYSQVNVRLPSNTEGAIPRLWDVRRRMEELKTSPDTVIMYGAIYCLLPILPEVVAQWILNTVLRKATVVLANIPGPQEMLTLGTKKLKKIVFWMSPRPEIPVVFSVISYAGAIQLSVSADKMVVPQPQLLIKEFVLELSRLSHLLARRRIPGEHRRRSHFTDERRLAEIINPPDVELQQKLHSVQEEIHEVTQQLSAAIGDRDFDIPADDSNCPEVKMLQRLDELREEFSELMRELRRRKSLADGTFVDGQDEDMDGELRRPRRLTLTSSTSRRSSLNTVLSSASTTRPLATPTISHHGFVVSTPNLKVQESPTSQQRPSFLQVAQERFGRRKSDFN
nr:uncharacterized protein LOC107441252 [Parasteatoda tepidariorum]